jgi:hypothetical protein
VSLFTLCFVIDCASKQYCFILLLTILFASEHALSILLEFSHYVFITSFFMSLFYLFVDDRGGVDVVFIGSEPH